jgi:polysaccharide pyruvyl transferase WcaK-like protein
MKAIYFNDLRGLPNFGCRSTGAALELILNNNGITVDRVDGIDSVNNSGWEGYAQRPIGIGGLKITRKIYKKSWYSRHAKPRLYNLVCKLDSLAGGIHDYVLKSPSDSVDLFLRLAGQDHYFRTLLARFEQADIVVINGEGTLIVSADTKRDALYILFVIELAQRLGKPVYLLNAMITSCPYEPPAASQLAEIAETLNKCKHIAVREQYSLEYVKSIVSEPIVTLVPDALFTWHSRYKWYKKNIQEWGKSTFSYLSDRDISKAIQSPYITLSASSSIWRYGETGLEAYHVLARTLIDNGINLVLVESCAGDGLLRTLSERLGIPLITREAPLDRLAGILSGSSLYISGRYHPAIASYCADVPCLFMGSNSHKTLSIQSVVGIAKPHEYSAAPISDEIEAIVCKASHIFSHGGPEADNLRPADGAINRISESISSSYASILSQ